jgi:hypothetical protein
MPAKLGQLACQIGCLPQIKNTVEARSGYRNPDAPDELVVSADNRNFEATANKELTVNLATIAIDFPSPRPFLIAESCPVIGRIADEIQRQCGKRLTAAMAGPSVIHSQVGLP